jgi:hypothetical protein
MTEQRPSELERLAKLHRRVAAHAEALAQMEREIAARIERTKLFAVLVADTAIAENYADPWHCLDWLTASHRAWLRTNQRFNEMAERLIFYRYMLLPYPSLLRNSEKRRLLIDVIMLHVHLHLWHGVICGIVFVDPRQQKIAEVLEDLNFIAIPSQQAFLDTPAFYRGENLTTSVITGSRADRQMAEAERALSGDGARRPVWLHYDERTFEGPRLDGWRWQALRRFFQALYGPRMRCAAPDCGVELKSFELDHIAPIGKRYYQTLPNFRPLCVRCNREKGDRLREDPFALRLMLPEDLRTRELEDIYRLPPPWLGRVATPRQAPRGIG